MDLKKHLTNILKQPDLKKKEAKATSELETFHLPKLGSRKQLSFGLMLPGLISSPVQAEQEANWEKTLPKKPTRAEKKMQNFQFTKKLFSQTVSQVAINEQAKEQEMQDVGSLFMFLDKNDFTLALRRMGAENVDENKQIERRKKGKVEKMINKKIKKTQMELRYVTVSSSYLKRKTSIFHSSKSTAFLKEEIIVHTDPKKILIRDPIPKHRAKAAKRIANEIYEEVMRGQQFSTESFEEYLQGELLKERMDFWVNKLSDEREELGEIVSSLYKTIQGNLTSSKMQMIPLNVPTRRINSLIKIINQHYMSLKGGVNAQAGQGGERKKIVEKKHRTQIFPQAFDVQALSVRKGDANESMEEEKSREDKRTKKRSMFVPPLQKDQPILLNLQKMDSKSNKLDLLSQSPPKNKEIEDFKKDMEECLEIFSQEFLPSRVLLRKYERNNIIKNTEYLEVLNPTESKKERNLIKAKDGDEKKGKKKCIITGNKIKLPFMKMDDMCIVHLIKNYYTFHSLLKVNLEGNEIGDKAGNLFISILYEYSRTIKSINLAQTGISTFTLASIKQLAEDNRVQIHSILVSLHHNFFSEIEICRFCVGISKNSNLTSLNISYCGLSKVSMRVLASVIKYDKKLKILDVSHNSSDFDSTKNLIQGLSRNTELLSLNIAHLGVIDEHIKYLMHSLKNNKSLIELILDGNNLTYKSCLFLTTLFKFNSTLLHLGLDQNNIGYEGINSLRDCPSRIPIQILGSEEYYNQKKISIVV